MIFTVLCCVADPHNFVADPDPACHFDADPDPACHFDALSDPPYQFKSDPHILISIFIMRIKQEKCAYLYNYLAECIA